MCRSFQALKWKEKHLYLVINVWPLRCDLYRHWFRTGGARLAFQAFICVLRLQTDITTQKNTSIVKVSKPFVKVSSCHCCLNGTAHLIANHCPLEMSVKFQGVLPLKSTVQPLHFSGNIFFFMLRKTLNYQRSSSLISRHKFMPHCT